MISPRSFETRLRTFEIRLRTFEIRLRTLEIRLRTLEIRLRTLEIRLRGFCILVQPNSAPGAIRARNRSRNAVSARFSDAKKKICKT